MNWDLLHNYIHHFWVLRTSFPESSGWLLPEIKTYNCVRLKPRQCAQVCTPIQTDLLKPENALLKYGNNHYFRGVQKKKFIAKSSKSLLGKRWWTKINLHRGGPNIFSESAMGEGLGQVLKIAAKGHYKRWSGQPLKYKRWYKILMFGRRDGLLLVSLFTFSHVWYNVCRPYWYANINASATATVNWGKFRHGGDFIQTVFYWQK